MGARTNFSKGGHVRTPPPPHKEKKSFHMKKKAPPMEKMALIKSGMTPHKENGSK